MLAGAFWQACLGCAIRSPTTPGVQPIFSKATVRYGKEEYAALVQPATPAAPKAPPLLLIPPVGVGIDKSFYDRLHSEWHRIGSPAAPVSYTHLTLPTILLV